MEAATTPPSRNVPHWTTGLVLLLVLVAAVAIAWQRKTTKNLTAENQQVTQALQQTQAQLSAMQAKLDAMSATPPVAVQVEPKPAAAVVHHAKASAHHSSHKRQADDPRWKQFQSRLDDQGKQIEANKQDLASARTELSGSIARTHDELVALERQGERSYFEFDITKSKQFRATGPVGIRLKKANTKHSYADLELMVDDADLSKKHVNLYEPVMFYASENGRPVELVINSIGKDHIHGYVATPRYSKTELAAMSSGNGAEANGNPAPARKKLELPKD